MTHVLGRRALNRATLDRQLLLRRSELPVVDAVRRLAGLQAQTPHTWYVGLWSRLTDFNPGQAAELLVDRSLIRIALMRSTIHLVTPEDARALRPLIQPVLDRDLYRNFTHGKPIQGIDMAQLVADGIELLAPKPLPNKELGALLAERWPGRPPASLVYAIRNQVPLVQVPPRAVWGRSGPIAHTTADAWLGANVGASVPATASLEWMIRRYLAAFGPASVKDMQVWSGLTKLREVVEPMSLQVFLDEHGQTLYDLPDTTHPDPESPAPPRFLYDFDNLLLSYADRTRVITDDHARHRTQRTVPQILLVDGFTAGDWTVGRDADEATLTIRTYQSLTDPGAVVKEAEALLAFLHPDAGTRKVLL
ncbi:winged helix DNA-binding domain-containing protein [Kribbella sp. NPDC048928]|uniref:winged helix DNA-binding domain-containing protein n=1 Tax=Kribbella sp. NPDC048928 TaxID=3364111 RepID=UPI0037160E70